MKKLVLGTIASAAVWVFAVPAFATNYECILNMKNSDGNWMGPTIYVTYDEKRETASVIDGVINHFVGAAVETTSIVDNAKRVSFRYKLESVKGTTSARAGVANVNLIYSLTIKKPSLKAVITMKPIGYDNTFRDTGFCKITK